MILLLSGVDAQPLVNADGRLLGADTLVTAIANTLYDDSAWSYLSDLLGAALNDDPSIAFESADAYNGRGPDGSYASNTTEAFIAVNCIDVPVDAPEDSGETTSVAAEVTGPDEETLVRAPILGPYLFSPVDICSVWPVSPRGSSRPLVADGAPDLLVIGTTNDPATPYADAVALAEQMSSAHLVTLEGEGHCAYNRGNSCIDEIVDRYFLYGEIPPADIICS
jgi:hypothetical protein